MEIECESLLETQKENSVFFCLKELKSAARNPHM